MNELAGKTAVVTGGGSGIGRELAARCAAEKMRIVLCDVDEAGMAATAGLLAGVEVLTVRCDVSRADEVRRLADAAYERFGAVHLLCNNAGVAVGGPLCSATPEDWQWVLGVNLMGVVHGVSTFVPRMLAQGEPGHVVNTASVAGLLSIPGMSVYCVSKHAVVTLSECLHHELRLAQAKIGVSVLCPAFVDTAIVDSGRNRPTELAATNPGHAAVDERIRHATRAGRISAANVARITVEAVKEGRFWVLTHPKIKAAVEVRMREILDEAQPTNPMP